MIEPQQYETLIAKESLHWGDVNGNPQNPQIWHDPELFAIFFGKEYKRLIDRTLLSGPRILELGCGKGDLSLELASRGMLVTGIDLSPKRIEQAESKAKALGLKNPPSFQIGDLNTITLPDQAFDCVVAHDALHHILNLSRLCEEVARTLAPGGSVLVVDYVGMGMVRKIVAAFLYAVLPTYQPYRAKWALRSRLRAFFATEHQKRTALELQPTGALHHDSPFEEISQESIIKEVQNRFDVIEMESFCPFWFYLAAKVRLPKRMKYSVARLLRALDDMIVSLRLSRGAYIWIQARNHPQQRDEKNATPHH